MTYTLTSTSGEVVMDQSANTTALVPLGSPAGVDALIDQMWQVCLELDDESDIQISARHDQWWGATAICSHGAWRGCSNGAIDLSTAFVHLHKAFTEGHESCR